jgi:hypothetical protein
MAVRKQGKSWVENVSISAKSALAPTIVVILARWEHGKQDIMHAAEGLASSRLAITFC